MILRPVFPVILGSVCNKARKLQMPTFILPNTDNYIFNDQCIKISQFWNKNTFNIHISYYAGVSFENTGSCRAQTKGYTNISMLGIVGKGVDNLNVNEAT